MNTKKSAGSYRLQTGKALRAGTFSDYTCEDCRSPHVLFSEGFLQMKFEQWCNAGCPAEFGQKTDTPSAVLPGLSVSSGLNAGEIFGDPTEKCQTASCW